MKTELKSVKFRFSVKTYPYPTTVNTSILQINTNNLYFAQGIKLLLISAFLVYFLLESLQDVPQAQD